MRGVELLFIRLLFPVLCTLLATSSVQSQTDTSAILNSTKFLTQLVSTTDSLNDLLMKVNSDISENRKKIEDYQKNVADKITKLTSDMSQISSIVSNKKNELDKVEKTLKSLNDRLNSLNSDELAEHNKLETERLTLVNDIGVLSGKYSVMTSNMQEVQQDKSNQLTVWSLVDKELTIKKTKFDTEIIDVRKKINAEIKQLNSNSSDVIVSLFKKLADYDETKLKNRELQKTLDFVERRIKLNDEIGIYLGVAFTARLSGYCLYKEERVLDTLVIMRDGTGNIFPEILLNLRFPIDEVSSFHVGINALEQPIQSGIVNGVNIGYGYKLKQGLPLEFLFSIALRRLKFPRGDVFIYQNKKLSSDEAINELENRQLKMPSGYDFNVSTEYAPVLTISIGIAMPMDLAKLFKSTN